MNSMPSPDPFYPSTHDPEYQQLRKNVQRLLHKALSGADPQKVDKAWESYQKLRVECLQLCTSLLKKSRKLPLALFPSASTSFSCYCESWKLTRSESNGRNASLDSAIGPLDTRSSFSGSVHETSLPFHVNGEWLSAINEYKSIQESMLENIRNSLLAIYKSYEPQAPERQMELFLVDKNLRKNLVGKWREASVHRMRSEKPLFWDHYKIRLLNFDRLKLDLQAIEKLFEVADSGESPDMKIREYVIWEEGDSILEFANRVSEIHPILRFRVSSHYLAGRSPLFAHIFSSQQPGNNPPLEIISQLPPPPTRHVCKDGMEVKVYRMPQIELNTNESLTILLNAAHMNNAKVPRQIDFPVFVSIAEVCLKYDCTSPLELQVECFWLRQWETRILDENDDGFLLISYVFGLKTIFTRTSKSAILNAKDENEIESKELWPRTVRDKIKATRAAKLAQIRECCRKAIEEYFRAPSEATDRRSSVGSLQLTTMPRCPKGSHQCDATNLGWLMLVYNELRLLPSLMNGADFPNLPKAPKRSLKELVDCMRLMPSAPQVHSGICDYAPAFRSEINDIYNSVMGLTLRDVSGRDGWALSKDARQADDTVDGHRGAIELPAEPRRPAAMSNEDISLRILSHIDNLKDLNAAAMIDRTFYGAYKRNEASLLKNIMKAERRRTLSFQANAGINGFRETLNTKSDPMARRPLNVSTRKEPEGAKYLKLPDTMSTPPPPFTDSGGEDFYDSSPHHSPTSYDDITHEEAQKILWPDDQPNPAQELLRANRQMGERNEKCLAGDVSHIEDKARMVEDDKHLRDEKDEALGLGIHKK